MKPARGAPMVNQLLPSVIKCEWSSALEGHLAIAKPAGRGGRQREAGTAARGTPLLNERFSSGISCVWEHAQHKFLHGVSVYELKAGYPAPSRR